MQRSRACAVAGRSLSRRALLGVLARGLSASAVAGALAACARAQPVAPSPPPPPSATPTQPATAGATPTPPPPAATAPPTATTPPPTRAPTATATAVPAHVVPEGIAWLRDHAIPLATDQPGGDLADLAPLRDIVGDARIVALGEATHGTRQFFTMKHRLVEFLVREMGFTLFAMEASWPEAERIDGYVRGGTGNAAQLLRGMHFWIWDTVEVLDLIEWLRAYNQQRRAAPAVGFSGFDMQYPRLAIDNLLTYMGRVEPAARDRFRAYYEGYLPHAAGEAMFDYFGLPAAAKIPIRDALQEAHDDLAARRAAYEAASSARDYAHALQSARLVVQAEAFYAIGKGRGGEAVRDRAMAENAAWLLEQAGPAAKIILWAHNGHVSAAPLDTPPGAFRWMGTHLRRQYGDQLVAIGFTFYQGAFNAIDRITGRLEAHRALPPPPDSYEAAFRQADLPRLLLDLRDLPDDKRATRWLWGPRRLRDIGSGYDRGAAEEYYAWPRLPEEFDAFIYLQDTTPSILLPR